MGDGLTVVMGRVSAEEGRRQEEGRTRDTCRIDTVIRWAI